MNGIIFCIFKNTIGGILFGYKHYDLYTSEKISSKQMSKIITSYFLSKIDFLLNLIFPISTLINIVKSLLINFHYGISFTDIECEVKKQKSDNLRNKFSVFIAAITLVAFSISVLGLISFKFPHALDKQAYYNCVSEKFTREEYTNVLEDPKNNKDLSKIKNTNELYNFVDGQTNGSCIEKLSSSKIDYTYSDSDILDIANKLDSGKYHSNFNIMEDSMNAVHKYVLQK